MGISLSSQVQSSLWLLALALGAAGFVLTASIALQQRTTEWVFLFVFLLGAARYELDRPQVDEYSIARFTDQQIAFEGIVVAEPDVRIRATNLTLRPTRLVSPEVAILPGSDLVRVRAPVEGDWRYGDVVRVEGRLESPPIIGRFNYRAYLSARDIFAWVPRPVHVERLGYAPENSLAVIVLSVKDALHQAILRNLPVPESALLSGIVLGREQLIPESLKEAFQATGTAHIVAISGANISVLIAVALGVFWRAVSRRFAATVALGLVWLYVVLVGLPASAVRAAAMASLMLVGMLVWRRGISLNTLCGGVGLIVLVSPRMVFDVGFQLSAAATLGLVLFVERMARPMHRQLEARVQHPSARRVLTLLADGALVTLAAQITTLPLLLHYFESLSLTALAANLLILPLQPPIMVFGLAAAIVGAILPPLGVLAAGFVYPFLTLTIRIVRWMADSPFEPLPIHGFGMFWVLAYYTALAVVLWVGNQRQSLAQFLRGRALYGSLALIALLSGVAIYLQRPDGRLWATFAGSSALIQSPTGVRLAFVGDGSFVAALDRWLLPWERQLDYVVLSEATDRARQSAVSLLEGYRVRTLIAPVMPAETFDDADLHLAWHRALDKVDRVRFGPQAAIALDDTVVVDVVSHAPTFAGAQTLGVRVAHRSVRLDLVGVARASTLFEDAALVFAAPRAMRQTDLERVAPRWVIWADAPGRPPMLRSAIYALWLRTVNQAAFASDGSAVQRVR